MAGGWENEFDEMMAEAPARLPVPAAKGKWEGEDEDDEDIPVTHPTTVLSNTLTDCRMSGTQNQKKKRLRKWLLHRPQSTKRVSSKLLLKEKKENEWQRLKKLSGKYDFKF